MDHPVFAGDIISVTARVKSARISNSKPDRGILLIEVRARNQNGQDVMAFHAASFVLIKPQELRI